MLNDVAKTSILKFIKFYNVASVKIYESIFNIFKRMLKQKTYTDNYM